MLQGIFSGLYACRKGNLVYLSFGEVGTVFFNGSG
jgi:hypothetical protein